LGISRDADEATIKKAYRRKAKEHHPDKGGDAEEFKKVQKAYAILSDPDKRKRYDAGEDVDQRNGPSIEDRAAELIMQGFDQVLELEQIPGDDPLALVMESIQQSLKSVLKDIAGFEKTIKRMEKQERKVKRKKKAKPGDNLWLRVVQTKKQRAQLTMGKANEYREVLQIAEKLLEEYEASEPGPIESAFETTFESLRKAARFV